MTELVSLDMAPLTPVRWPDLDAVFGARGCSVARGCWCMAYRLTGTMEVPEGLTRSQAYRSSLRALVEAGVSPGLIGYRDGVPVGWISLGPREQYERLRRSPVMKAVDDLPVWSIVCFVVPGRHRGQGVARALLRGAVAYAKEQGATILEAYPVDKPGPSKAEDLWFGTKSMFDQAGFVEVARRRPHRPVVRLELR